MIEFIANFAIFYKICCSKNSANSAALREIISHRVAEFAEKNKSFRLLFCLLQIIRA